MTNDLVEPLLINKKSKGSIEKVGNSSSFIDL